jgi:hypothetical protein
MVVGRSAIQLIFKMVFGTTNFLACIVFLVMLKKAAQGGHINAVRLIIN